METNFIITESENRVEILNLTHNGESTTKPINLLLAEIGGDIMSATEANSGGHATSRTWTVRKIIKNMDCK